MRHEPFVIVIVVLVGVLIAMCTLKKDANWFGCVFGFFLIFLVFYT
jgi:membrane-bound ClpP family serine protease